MTAGGTLADLLWGASLGEYAAATVTLVAMVAAAAKVADSVSNREMRGSRIAVPVAVFLYGLLSGVAFAALWLR